uniref:Protein KTI12 homolog n=1 Tax=Leptobrachium leishanense TaxID=445787 RepID=A0A8C5MA92_9ANUR
MPLVIMCGFPCSGKSRRAKELQEYLEKSGRKVHIIGDHVLELDKNAVYADSRKEKEVRGPLRAAVERQLNKEDIVILDSLNYIKGYRYELFCLIKHVQTPHCLCLMQDYSRLCQVIRCSLLALTHSSLLRDIPPSLRCSGRCSSSVYVLKRCCAVLCGSHAVQSQHVSCWSCTESPRMFLAVLQPSKEGWRAGGPARSVGEIHCLTAPEISSTWNQQRDPSEQYTQEIFFFRQVFSGQVIIHEIQKLGGVSIRVRITFDALVQRFESPDSRNRWDSPLFTVHVDDNLPSEQISDAIFHRKAPPPNQSTQTQPLSSTNFLHELDKVTQDVVTAVLNAQKTSVPGDVIVVPGASERIELPRILNMSELRRCRHQFISYTKMHPNENISQLANMFVQYLNKSIH